MLFSLETNKIFVCINFYNTPLNIEKGNIMFAYKIISVD